MSTSLDGSVALVDTIEGRVVGRIETGREKAAQGEAGESQLDDLLDVELDS